MGGSPEILGPMELSDMEGWEPFEDWKPVRDQMLFENHEAFGDQKAFEDHKSFRDHKPFEDHKSFEDLKPIKDQIPFEDHRSFEDQKHLSPLHSNPSPSKQITTDIKAEHSSKSKGPMELSEGKDQIQSENQRSSEGWKNFGSRKRRHVYSSTIIKVCSGFHFPDSAPLSARIINQLEEWHQKYSTRKPPFSAGCAKPSVRKIFDLQGGELKFANYYVSMPIRYYVKILYYPDDSQKLVPSFPTGTRWSFLIGWQGLEHGYEDETCAVSGSGQLLDRIRYSPAVWQATLRKPPTAREQQNNAMEHYRRQRLPAPDTNDYSAPATESKEPNTPDSDESSDSKPWDGGDVSLAGVLVAKKGKIDDESNSLPIKGPEVVFKLVCDNSKASRAFTLHDACPGKELFAKARQFYQVSCPDVEVNIVICRIPASNEQRYLFDGSEHEVADFVREMKGLSRISGDSLLIEVVPRLLKPENDG